MIRHFVKLSFLWGGLFLGTAIISAFALPAVFDALEVWRAMPLPYEAILRVSIATWFLIFLTLAFAWLLRFGQRRHWILFLLHCFSFTTLLFIFWGDQTHRLMEEWSWIRYTTAGFLVLASVVSALLAFRTRGTLVATRVPLVFWLFMAGAFLYAGLDEVFEVHEAIGRLIERTLHLPHVTTDLITVGYALAALCVLGIFFRIFRKEYIERHRFSLFLFLAGGIVYFFSTMFDTIDIVVGRKLTSFAKVLSIDPSFFFSDAWAVLWAPKNLFNGVEEVFEHSAAVLFFSAVLFVFLEKRYAWVDRALPLHRFRSVFSWMVFGTFGLGFSSLLVISVFSMSSHNGPLAYDDRAPSVQRIAGAFDGLSHTDDLFFHPSWGLLVANEGGGNVYQWSVISDQRSAISGQWYQLPDPEKLLRDVDSVTATEDAVYVADGSRGAIARYTKEEGWQDVWTKQDGLKHPEALVAVGDIVYALDESERAMIKLAPGKKPEVWKPSHPAWKAPEGIALYPGTNTFLVTDDESGALFMVDFGVSVTPFAQLSKPEDITVTDNGDIFVTDNGWGAIFSVTKDGRQKKVAQFLRPYRDLQGIAVDDRGMIYVVTSDGFDRVSFMPSTIFQISDF